MLYLLGIQSQDGVRASRTASEQWANVRPLGRFAARGRGLAVLTNILRLQVSFSKGQVVQTTLIDASGRSILRRDFVAQTPTHQEVFGVSELPTGMYFLQVVTAEKQAVLKVVKVE